ARRRNVHSFVRAHGEGYARNKDLGGRRDCFVPQTFDDHLSVVRKAFISRRTSASFDRHTEWSAFGRRTTRADGTPFSNAAACAPVDSTSAACRAAREGSSGGPGKACGSA